MEPKFASDCDSCVFLGHFYDHDVYRCDAGPAIVARYGDAVSNHWSLSVSSLETLFTRTNWVNDRHVLAMIAGVCCDKVSSSPQQRRKTMADVKRGVSQLAWDMVTDVAESLPDSGESTAAAMALHAFYEARALLEQAEHRLAAAMALKGWCDQKRKDGANGVE